MRRAMFVSLGGLEGIGHCEGDLCPLPGLGSKLAMAGFGEAVELRAAVVLRFAPVGGEPACFFHAMECGEEGAGFDAEGSVGDLLDAPRDAEAVEFAGADGLEDKEIEGALEEVGLVLVHAGGVLLSAGYMSLQWLVQNVNRR